jgi:hypothetical protein
LTLAAWLIIRMYRGILGLDVCSMVSFVDLLWSLFTLGISFMDAEKQSELLQVTRWPSSRSEFVEIAHLCFLGNRFINIILCSYFLKAMAHLDTASAETKLHLLRRACVTHVERVKVTRCHFLNIFSYFELVFGKFWMISTQKGILGFFNPYPWLESLH